MTSTHLQIEGNFDSQYYIVVFEFFFELYMVCLTSGGGVGGAHNTSMDPSLWVDHHFHLQVLYNTTLVCRIIVSKLLLILMYLVLRNSLIRSETIINFSLFGTVKCLFQVRRLLIFGYFSLWNYYCEWNICWHGNKMCCSQALPKEILQIWICWEMNVFLQELSKRN